MKKLLVTGFAVLLLAGCASYRADLVPTNEPKDQSYCQRIDDMAVGLDPYMVKEKTALTFDSDLTCDKVLALNVSMLADGKSTYKVRRDGITAADEFGKSYAPMSAEDAAKRMERWLRHDKPRLYDTIKDREMPDEVTVSNQTVSSFVYFDMKPNKTDSRKFTVMIPAVSADGTHKDFKITVDPYLAGKNPAERWDSYSCSGNPCCQAVKTAAVEKPAPVAAAPAQVNDEAAKRAEDAAKRAEDAARRAEAAANKQQKAFEKGLEK